MDFDRIEKKLTQYRQPEGAFEQLKKKEKDESRQLRGQDVQPGGEAGAESNIPGYETEDTTVTRYNEQTNMVEYYADKNVKNIVKDPALSRVSTVVSVDGKYTFEMDEETGEIEENYVEPSEEEMEAIRNMARAAVGYSEDRGDQIQVTHLKFDRSDEIKKELEQRRQAEFRRKVIYFASIALGITFFISGLLLLWHRRQKKQAEQEMAPGPEEEPELPTRDVMAEVSVEEQEEERKTQEVKDTVGENPETAAQVLRSWFAEEI